MFAYSFAGSFACLPSHPVCFSSSRAMEKRESKCLLFHIERSCQVLWMMSSSRPHAPDVPEEPPQRRHPPPSAMARRWRAQVGAGREVVQVAGVEDGEADLDDGRAGGGARGLPLGFGVERDEDDVAQQRRAAGVRGDAEKAPDLEDGGEAFRGADRGYAIAVAWDGLHGLGIWWKRLSSCCLSGWDGRGEIRGCGLWKESGWRRCIFCPVLGRKRQRRGEANAAFEYDPDDLETWSDVWCTDFNEQTKALVTSVPTSSTIKPVPTRSVHPVSHTHSRPTLFSTMRLLQTDPVVPDAAKLQLHEFFGDNIPPYAILSHTWGSDEVTFDDVQNGTVKGREGSAKIDMTLSQARKDGHGWLWIDTCCINKDSSAELSEAINSMFDP
nr:vegetative incompatibility protein het-e-1 [Quercus suber]